MKDGGKMMNMINIFKGMIGIGKPIQHMETGVVLKSLLRLPLHIILCHITMPYWVSAGIYTHTFFKHMLFIKKMKSYTICILFSWCRSRTTPYTDDEVKVNVCFFISSLQQKFMFVVMQLQTAFRSKAMQYHPDQNQENKGRIYTTQFDVDEWL